MYIHKMFVMQLVDLAEEGDMEQTVARKTQSEEDKQRRIEELKVCAFFLVIVMQHDVVLLFS